MLTLKKYLVCGLLMLSTTIASADNIELHVMGGQSNMQGWRSDAKSYPADPNRFDQTIPLKHYGFSPSIFKFSFGSSSLVDVWKAPGHGGLYDRMIRELQLSIRLLQQAGHTVEIKSFTWIQGETDAKNDQYANQYYWNLQRLISHFRRNVARNPQLPVILGVDEQHPHVKLRPQVVTAQKKLSQEDPNIAYTSMYGLEKSDVTHLTARGVIQHGQRLFKAYLDLSYKLNF